MKQNSSILFHCMPQPLIFRYRGVAFFIVTVFLLIWALIGRAAPPEDHESFDPAKSFKPAQRSLTQIYLQLAGSLEACGSPMPYWQHVAAEHARIANLYREKTGNTAAPFRPTYLTEDYLNKASANWTFLSTKLPLESLAKGTGRHIRVAILGAKDASPTEFAKILSHHQTAVADRMAGKPTALGEFGNLRAELEKQLSKRDLGTAGAPAAQILTLFQNLYAKLDQGMSAPDASKLKAALTSFVMDTGEMADSELRAGLLAWALETPKPYDPQSEITLSASEREQLAALLAKSRFTKADLAELNRFYSGPYERLSEDGKDQLSRRVWRGIQK